MSGASLASAADAFARHARAGLDPCVHCGFCLPACPTYEVTADEADSPRGRIVLMRALARGTLPPDDPGLQTHLDRCLGCRACESVCPAGVVFGPALEDARARIAGARPLPAMLRLALWVLARPVRQRALWALARLVRASGLPARLARGAGTGGGAFAQALAMLAATRSSADAAVPGGPAAPDTSVALFTGCVMEGLFGHVHQATTVALAHNGVGALEVPGQACCGALAAHAGDGALARELARVNVRAFDAAAADADIVVNSAGCGAMMKAYGEWLADDPLAGRARAFSARVRDVSEVLAERGPAPGRRPLALKVAYDAPCHLLHAQRVADAPLRLLAAVPALDLVPLEGAERCCGSAGLYALIEPAMSREVLASKLAAIRLAAPDIVATGNPGCLMQVGAGLLLDGQRVEVRHPVELLAWSYG